MKRVAYIHKFYHGVARGSLRVRRGYDHADQIAARLRQAYAAVGWEYEVSRDRTPSPPGRLQQRRLFA